MPAIAAIRFQKSSFAAEQAVTRITLCYSRAGRVADCWTKISK
jgi:hypothetical protein